MWNGRQPSDVYSASGANFGDVDQWKDGIVTRGVLLDVPRFRGASSITVGQPVHGAELAEVAKSQGVTLESGDALVVYGGRDRFVAEHPDWHSEQKVRPGLHLSCLPFVRENDVSVLLWDFMDEHPCAELYEVPYGAHAALMSYGVALVDNCYLEDLSEACAELGRYEFLLVLAPLRLVGGTGCPINPVAIL
jgi:kynurenine formamidase